MKRTEGVHWKDTGAVRGRVVCMCGMVCYRMCVYMSLFWQSNCVGIFVESGFKILVSIVVSIPACHAGDPGSIPGRGAFLPLSIRFSRKRLV